MYIPLSYFILVREFRQTPLRCYRVEAFKEYQCAVLELDENTYIHYRVTECLPMDIRYENLVNVSYVNFRLACCFFNHNENVQLEV
jgi:hypothetical protein